MNSSKKKIATTGSRSVTNSCSTNKNATVRKATSTQTDKRALPFEELFKSNINPKEDLFTFDDETQKGYSLALNFINNVHVFMNKKLCENFGDCGDTNSEANSIFKLPDVPNFAPIFLMLLEKSKPTNLTIHRVPVKEDSIKCIMKSNLSEFAPDIQKSAGAYKTLENIEKLSAATNAQGKQNDSKTKSSDKIEEDNVVKDTRDFNLFQQDDMRYVRKIEIHSRRDDGVEEDEAVVVANQIEDKLVIVNAEDANLNSSPNPTDAFDNYEYKKCPTPEAGPNLEQESIADLIKKRVQKEFMTYLHKTNEKQTRLVSTSQHVVNIQPQINLLEYAQKKLERQNCEAQVPQYYNNAECASKKVTDMFQRISQENLRNGSKVNSDRKNVFNAVDNDSDSDSVILDDEEFERLHLGYYREENIIQDRGNEEISHPLRLGGKDMPKLNEKMLNTIGLFTERGDIRPGILDIMEKKKRAKASDSKNKQFRVKRQWDLQIHLTPKNNLTSLTSVSTEKSFITMSSDFKSGIERQKR